MANGDASIRSTVRDWKYRTGWILSCLAILFLVMDSTMKLLAMPVVLEAGAALGLVGAPMARELGAILMVCTILYAAPRTAVLGAILLTGFLGGAVAAHLRAGDPLFSHVLFGVYLGVVVWAGIYLRDANLRMLVPTRKN
jgi:DoxX-like family